ncbi:MAG: hypothetical protein Q7O66_18085 [Dehalococcoidia bacterium]|nr:hypothetical protein [Dehalococcoidia bacterium]
MITDRLGQVAIFTARDTPVTVPATSVFDREKALAVARSLVDYEPTREWAELDIGPELTGRQVLRWTVLVEGPRAKGSPSENDGLAARAEIVIDALSGETLSIVKWN